MNKPGHQTHMNFADSFYFSSVTFTTLGYGDFTPNGFLRVVTAFEAIFGGMSIGFLVAGFANLKY
jgi:voltage-gated potassium channel Kch